jgi:hypothetical protein
LAKKLTYTDFGKVNVDVDGETYFVTHIEGKIGHRDRKISQFDPAQVDFVSTVLD